MSKYKECPHCGSALDHGEKCDCEKQRSVLLNFSDGDELITRINGTDEEIIQHYGLNNFLTDTSDDMRVDDAVVTSLKFLDTGRTVNFSPMQRRA